MASLLQITFALIAGLVAVYYSGKGPLILRKVNTVLHGKPGCNPVQSLGNVTLHYFAGRGRAEPIRLLLEEAGVHYEQISFDKDSWPEQKKKGLRSGFYTFGQVPAVETTGGLRMVQTQAIAHYFGRSTGMDCDCEDLHHCQVIALGVEDARSKLSKMLYDPDFNLKDREVYLKDTMPLWFGHMERLAPPLTNQDNPVFVGERLTWVDFLVYDLLENNVEFSRFDFKVRNLIQVDVLANFPKLKNFYTNFAKRPHISRYMKSARRYPYKIPNIPKDAVPPSEKE